MGSFAAQFLDPGVAIRYLPAMLRALGVTVGLALLVIATGLAAGLLLCLLRTLRIRSLSLAVVAYADVFRCIPPLTLMFVFFFAFPLAGWSMSGPAAAWLALSLVLAAFSEEVFWTAVLSVDKGQWDAARSTGLGFGGTLRHVVMPQAMRIALPPLTNRTIAITKGVALASAVSVPEMLGEATAATSYASNSTPLMMAAAGYLAIFLPLAVFSRWLEQRMRWGA